MRPSATAAVRELLPAAGAAVALTAKPVFLPLEEAGELTGVSHDTIIGRTGAGETGAFEACRRTLTQQQRWQRRPRP
jgi:hypothetical protein